LLRIGTSVSKAYDQGVGCPFYYVTGSSKHYIISPTQLYVLRKMPPVSY